jgi:outer membrane biosynthesis protein TonB
MTVSEAESANAAERMLLWAVVFSLCIHLAVFGGWKWGQAHGLWKHLSLPAWMEMGRKNLTANIARALPPVKKPQEAPMLFVDVDPALATETPPEKPKFYAPNNSVAANPVKTTPSDLPQIDGTQNKVVKTIAEGAKTVPLQPSPPKEEKADTSESKPLPKTTYAPGDLAMAKPTEKPREEKGTSDSDQGTAAQPEPKHERPRTINEALARMGTPAPKSRENGGVAKLALDSSMDAMRTSYGEYDRDFIEAVRSRWYALLENRQYNIPGRVVVEFDLHSDGRISDMRPPAGDEADELLRVICQQAVLDPAPYAKWPQKMREEVPDPRHLKFTFFYENE